MAGSASDPIVVPDDEMPAPKRIRIDPDVITIDDGDDQPAVGLLPCDIPDNGDECPDDEGDGEQQYEAVLKYALADWANEDPDFTASKQRRCAARIMLMWIAIAEWRDLACSQHGTPVSRAASKVSQWLDDLSTSDESILNELMRNRYDIPADIRLLCDQVRKDLRVLRRSL